MIKNSNRIAKMAIILILGQTEITNSLAADTLTLKEYSKKNSEQIVKILKEAKIEMTSPPDEGSPFAGHGKKVVPAEKLYILNLVYCVKDKKRVVCERPTLVGKPAEKLYEILVKEKVKIGKPEKRQTSVFLKELICLPPEGKLPAVCRGETHYKK
jgi:hypothetical protein